MAENEMTVTLTPEEWHLVQEALDVYYYETEHNGPGGLTRKGRERRQIQRERRLEMLGEVDEKIAQATGLPPMLC
jgi:hypothetical protein